MGEEKKYDIEVVRGLRGLGALAGGGEDHGIYMGLSLVYGA